MALNNITFVLGQGGLGRPLPGEDYVSGLLFYTPDASLPSGFPTTARVKQLFSVGDAEAAGIKDDYADGTAATSTNTITAIGANGSTVELIIPEPDGSRSLGVYTKTAGETDVDDVAAALAAMVNAGTADHGYTATADGVPAGEFVITAPKRMGTFLNTKLPTFTEVPSNSTFAVTVAAFTGGVASKQAIWHYHISEFFRIQPQGNLYVGFYDVPGTYNYNEVTTMQSFANGRIRQIGVYKDGTAFAPADLTALDLVCKSNISNHKELIGILGADISATVDLSTLADLRTLTANNAAICIAQDGAALGAFLYKTTGKSITALGAMLGAAALAKVSESIAWVEKFNMSNGTELDVIGFANGQLYKDLTAINENLVTLLQNYCYTFLRSFVGVSGSYWNDNKTAISNTSDYSSIRMNRTIQKAQRVTYISLVPALSSPTDLNADGTLQDTTIAYFESLAEKGLQQMQRDAEISAFTVAINPAQNILQTDKLIVTISIVPKGVAANIQVNIGFNVSIN